MPSTGVGRGDPSRELTQKIKTVRKKLSVEKLYELLRANKKIKVRINSPDGMVRVKKVFSKGLKECVQLGGLKASTGHLVEERGRGWVRLDSIGEKDQILTEGGFKELGLPIHIGEMETYDLTVDHENHRYYAEGISSHNCNNKTVNLKACSEKRLGRKMLEIHELFGIAKKKGETILFDRLCASDAYVYGASDACNTFGLLMYYQQHPHNPLTDQPNPVLVDHRMVDVLRNLYRNGLPVNIKYFIYAALDVLNRYHKTESAIHAMAGRIFDVTSPQQLSRLLYDVFKIPPPEGLERGKSGYYSTAEDVMDKLYKTNPDVEILHLVVTHRKLLGTLGKLFLKALINSYVDGYLPYARVQLQFNQCVIPTGRLASGSSGMAARRCTTKQTKTRLSRKFKTDSGDCGFNSQGVDGSYFRRGKARRIKKLNISPEHLGFDVENPYPQTIQDELIRRVVEL